MKSASPLWSTAAALAIGLLIAAFMACGGAMAPRAVAPSAVPGSDAAGAPVMPSDPRDRQIQQLSEEIDAKLGELGISKPPPSVAATCVGPSCAQPTAPEAPVSPPPSTDTTCTHGPSQTCTDTCTLADSICTNAKKICEISQELPGDTWAQGKCNDGRASCKAARDRCCGCQ